MIFGKSQIEKQIKQESDRSYAAIVRQQFKKNRLAVWALRGFFLLLFMAVFADFMANERPIRCKIEGEVHYPIFRQYLVDLGLDKWEAKFVQTKWLEQKYDPGTALFTPIRYSPTTKDYNNVRFVGPFDKQVFEKDSNYGWHYLGTDNIGQDVASGMIHGVRVAMKVGFVAMFIATLIGLFLGALAGFFGDNKLQVSRVGLFFNLLGLFVAIFWAFIVQSFYFSDLLSEAGVLRALGELFLVFLVCLLSANLLSIAFKRIPGLGKKVTLPIDLMVMRFIEIFNSIPLLILILAIIAIVERPSISFVMAIIGLVSWTGIAKFVRSELLRIRKLEYIEAAYALGYSQVRIILKHALPNAVGPVLIAIAFGVASAILIEAFLSFIGVGLPDDEITWGSLLHLSREKFSAWWLVLFPGVAIFFTVTIFNLIGEGISDALDPKMKS